MVSIGMSSGRMYQKPGRLTNKGSAELQFKVPGNPTLRGCKPGKKVWVDRNQSNPGMFVIWINNKEYSPCAGEILHEHVVFE